ncbi:sensor histidine kinase [Cellulosilyticum sp. ST5]|uniref:sensor histidine kinase n=1 Tax=Cellulosilyticum sp. ST5 TaxID=3055805 RepID=UPI0039772FAD
MKIRQFISEQKVTIAVQLIILLCVNAYLFLLSTDTIQQEDILYLDMVLITFYLGGFYISYIKWKSSYEQLYHALEEGEDITREEIKGDDVSGEIMRYIVDTKELKFAKEQANNEERIKEMEEYLSKWVHEIKLPISALSMMVERIEDDEVGYDVKHEIERINLLVNNVLYGSRATAAVEDLFIREERLDEIVKTAIRQSAFFLIKNNIEVEMAYLNLEAYTDKKWLVYVIGQMISNAIKYAGVNGKISFYGEEDAQYIILNIKDYGVGIAEEDQERIFNKGFTGKNGRNTTYKSTGMGLYFSKKILDKLGHDIEVESVEGKYTLFRIKFYKISDYIKVAKM